MAGATSDILKPPFPTALDAGEQLALSREQTAEMQAETELARLQAALPQSDARAVAARAKYEAEVQKLRAAHKAAPGCNLTVAQTWTCPPAAPPPAKP